MNIEEMVRAVQAELGVEIDGRAGPQTWAAIHARIVPARRRQGAAPAEEVDNRSEKCIATLLPEVRPYARALVHQAAAAGITIKIVDGSRSYAEQDALYAQGRTRPGAIVTEAQGGESHQNFGIAFDVGVFEGGRYLGDSPKYKAVGVLGMALGLEWGGNWKSITDQPHFQLRPLWAQGLTERQTLAGLRVRADVAEPLPA